MITDILQDNINVRLQINEHQRLTLKETLKKLTQHGQKQEDYEEDEYDAEVDESYGMDEYDDEASDAANIHVRGA